MTGLHDVIVVGCGPAGSQASLELAEMGFSVLALERGPLSREKPCAGGIQAVEVEEYRVPRELAERVIGAAHIEGWGHSVDIKVRKPGYTVMRGRYDSWLASKAAEAGAEVREHHRVVDVKRLEPMHYRVKAKHKGSLGS